MFDFSSLISDEMMTRITTSGLRILLILVLTLVALFLFRLLVRAIMGRVKMLDDEEGSLLDRRTDTIGRVIKTAGVAVIMATALGMTLEEMGIQVAPLLASVGVAGLALGLGAQTLVKDIIAGLFILTENQYAIGDVIKVNGLAGSVEEMTLRVTYLRDLEGVLHSVPNGEIRTDRQPREPADGPRNGQSHLAVDLRHGAGRERCSTSRCRLNQTWSTCCVHWSYWGRSCETTPRSIRFCWRIRW